MEINIIDRVNNRYQVKKSFDEKISISTILYYYAPIIGKNASHLYLLLELESENAFINNIYVSQDRLVTLMNASEDRLRQMITKLELVGLLTIYVNPASKDKITFVINKPYTSTQFLGNATLTKLLKAKIGEENVIVNRKPEAANKFKASEQDIMITKEFEIKAVSDIAPSDMNTTFDLSVIFDLLDKRDIDYSNWDPKIERAISDAVLIYDLSTMDIVNIIASLTKLNIPIEPATFNEFLEQNNTPMEGSINKVLNIGEMSGESQANLFKTIQPTELIKVLFERSANQEEIKLLILLKDKFGLENEIINVLLDHSKLINGAIVPNYIKKIAQTITKNNMKDFNEVVNHLKTAYKVSTKQRKRRRTDTDEDFELDFE